MEMKKHATTLQISPKRNFKNTLKQIGLGKALRRGKFIVVNT